MKNFIRLTHVNIKRLLKDPSKIAFTLVSPLLVILLVSFLKNDEEAIVDFSIEPVAYNIEDRGQVWKNVFPHLNKSEYVFINEKEKALSLLEKGGVYAVYNIPKDFTKTIKSYKKPIIKSFKTEEGNITIPIELRLEESINKWIEKKILIDKNIIKDKDTLKTSVNTVILKDDIEIDKDINIATTMIIIFIILGSSIISAELIELRDNNIISRSISTPNKNSSILGSITISLLFFQVIINILILFLGKVIIGYQIFHIHIIIINIILASLFSITLSLAITRILKDAGIVSLVTTLISIITLGLSTILEQISSNNLPIFIANLGKLTPQHWIFDSIERSILFPNVFVVLLMIIALFTAGSYKLKDF